MSSQTCRAGGAVPTWQQTTVASGKKRMAKRVAVDQYMARALLDEIPAAQPHTRRGERLPQPAVLPSMVQLAGENIFYCQLCDVPCSSYTVLRQHQAGISHRRRALIAAVTSNRFLGYLLVRGTLTLTIKLTLHPNPIRKP